MGYFFSFLPLRFCEDPGLGCPMLLIQFSLLFLCAGSHPHASYGVGLEKNLNITHRLWLHLCFSPQLSSLPTGSTNPAGSAKLSSSPYSLWQKDISTWRNSSCGTALLCVFTISENDESGSQSLSVPCVIPISSCPQSVFSGDDSLLLQYLFQSMRLVFLLGFNPFPSTHSFSSGAVV